MTCGCQHDEENNEWYPCAEHEGLFDSPARLSKLLRNKDRILGEIHEIEIESRERAMREG